MLFTKEDKILIKNFFELKGYNVQYYHQRISQQRLKRTLCLQVVAKAMGDWVGRSSFWQRQTTQQTQS